MVDNLPSPLSATSVFFLGGESGVSAILVCLSAQLSSWTEVCTRTLQNGKDKIMHIYHNNYYLIALLYMWPTAPSTGLGFPTCLLHSSPHSFSEVIVPTCVMHFYSHSFSEVITSVNQQQEGRDQDLSYWD